MMLRESIKFFKIINSIYNSNTYIVYRDNSQDVWLVDCGDVAPIIEWLDNNNKRVKGVFVTHTHYDHIYGIEELLNLYPDILIYTSVEGKVSFTQPKYNMSKYHGDLISVERDNIVSIKDGEAIELFEGVNIVAFSTPGHDWSCMCFRVRDTLFTGDSYIPGIKTVTTFPKSNKSDNIKSTQLIERMIQECDVVYPGHTII